VKRAVHLALELDGVDHAANVVGGDELHEAAIVVEDRHLRGETIGNMGFGTTRLVEVLAELRRVIADPLAVKNLTGKLGERLAAIQPGLERLASLGDRVAGQHGCAAGGGLAAIEH
jgi:hypothetical protein